MKSHPNPRKLWAYGGAVAGVTAIAVATLLLNALTLMPATHSHGPLHNSQTCGICQLQATGVWAPATAPVLPAPQALPWTSPHTTDCPRAQSPHPGPPSRGPPLSV